MRHYLCMNNGFEKQPTEANLPTDETSNDSTPVASLIERSILYDTSELQDATDAIISGLTDPNTDKARLKDVWATYAEIAEQIVESVENTPENPKAYARAQVEAIIHKALIFQSTGNVLRYVEELSLAAVRARNDDFSELITILNNEIATTIETLDVSPEVLVIKLNGVISDVDQEDLRRLIYEGGSFEDVMSDAYDMIREAGGNPDEILTEIGIKKS